MSERRLLNRGTGLLIIEVRQSNPNGDPDMESDPRTLETDGRGLISPVSFKRKLRDLMGNDDNPVRKTLKALGLINKEREYSILEERGRKRDVIGSMDAEAFKKMYWDARVFGNTFLESMDAEKNDTKKNKKDAEVNSMEKSHFISTGVVQFAPGVSIAPVEIVRLTLTNKAGVEKGKDRGMAPMAWRAVQHAVYAMPFFVNPMMAHKTGCDSLDIDILKFLIPHAYRNTTSAIRPFVEIRHAWYAEHKNPLGSCRDSLILDALMPKKSNGDIEEASSTIEDYTIPKGLPDEVKNRLHSFEDLCVKEWAAS